MFITLSLSFNLSEDIVLFCNLTIISSTTVNIGGHVSFWMMDFWGYRPRCGCQTLQLALLKCLYSGIWRLFSRGCWQCPFPPTLYWDSVSSWPSPTFAVCRLWWMSILTGGIWFRVIVLIVFPPVILRDAEHLLQYHFFSQRIWGNSPVAIGSLSWLFGIHFCNTLPRTFPEGSCH